MKIVASPMALDHAVHPKDRRAIPKEPAVKAIAPAIPKRIQPGDPPLKAAQVRQIAQKMPLKTTVQRTTK